MAKVELRLKEPKEVKHTLGKLYVRLEDVYILASYGGYILINLRTGGYYKTIKTLTELTEVIKNEKFEQIKDPTIIIEEGE